MRFARPELLWLLLALPAIAAAGWWLATRRRRALQRFAGGADWVRRFTGEVCPNRRAARLLLATTGFACLVLAAARPQWGAQFEEVTRGGADIVAVVDTSLSMSATDVPPSRIALARHGVDALLERVAGDRVGLVTFAGRAIAACPLTLDHAAVRLFLDAVDVEAAPVPGTALSDALDAALRAFGDAPEAAGTDDGRSRAIVLFTDGEDHEGGLDEALGRLAAARVAVYAIGVGTRRGAPIPLADASGAAIGYKTDAAGKIVTTRLDETVLERLALESGGRYYRATAAQDEIVQLAESLQGLDDRDFGAVLRARYKERFQLPLLLAVLAFLIEALFGDARPAKARGGGELPPNATVRRGGS